jgi:hypothetical protein
MLILVLLYLIVCLIVGFKALAHASTTLVDKEDVRC